MVEAVLFYGSARRNSARRTLVASPPFFLLSKPHVLFGPPLNAATATTTKTTTRDSDRDSDNDNDRAGSCPLTATFCLLVCACPLSFHMLCLYARLASQRDRLGLHCVATGSARTSDWVFFLCALDMTMTIITVALSVVWGKQE